RHTVVGLLEAFSRDAHAFNDSDVRRLSLLAELIVAALKPEEELRLIQAARVATRVTPEQAISKPAPVRAPAAQIPIPRPQPDGFHEEEPSFFPGYDSNWSSSPGLMVVAVVMVVAGLLAGGVYWKVSNTAPRIAATDSNRVQVAVAVPPASPPPFPHPPQPLPPLINPRIRARGFSPPP